MRYVHDSDLNIYWFSDKQSQHSRNIREHKNVFIVIYDSTVPEGKGNGLYIEAQAFEIADPQEIMHARRLKKGTDDHRGADEFLGEAVRRVYKAVPQRAWVNSAEIDAQGKFIRDFRIEVPLTALKKLCAAPGA